MITRIVLVSYFVLCTLASQHLSRSIRPNYRAFLSAAAPDVSEAPTLAQADHGTPQKIAAPKGLKDRILRVAVSSNRGEGSSNTEKNMMKEMVIELEAANQIQDATRSDRVIGEWDLVYSDTQLFRSSPFFMAGRAVCKDGPQADRFNLFCDLHREALAFTTIGKVKQIVTPDLLRSEFETTGAVIPGLPIVVKGTIMSTAAIEDDTGDAWVLRMESTKIKSGTSNIPFVKDFLDSSGGLPVQQLSEFLESNVPNYENPRPIFRVTYLDDDMRVSRDEDDNFFVYTKVIA